MYDGAELDFDFGFSILDTFHKASQTLQNTIFQNFNELDEREDEMRYKRDNDENFKTKFFELSKKYNENPKAIVNRTEFHLLNKKKKYYKSYEHQTQFQDYQSEENKNDDNEKIKEVQFDSKKKNKFDKKSQPFFPFQNK